MPRQSSPNTSAITLGIVLATLASIWALVFALWKLKHIDTYLTGWGTYVTGLATLALVIAALIAARTTIQELQEKRNFERAKWLSDLYKSHFEEAKFKEVRAKIDYENLDDFRTIINKDLNDRKAVARQSSLTPQERDLLDKFTDYFNFFELIGYLCELEVITGSDVTALFDYYLKRLIEVDSDSTIRNYLKAVNFEYLFRLLK